MGPKNNLVNGSPPRKYTVEQLTDAVTRSLYWREVLILLGIRYVTYNVQSVQNRADKLSIDTSHLKTNMPRKKTSCKYIPSQDYIDSGKPLHSSSMREEVISRG